MATVGTKGRKAFCNGRSSTNLSPHCTVQLTEPLVSDRRTHFRLSTGEQGGRLSTFSMVSDCPSDCPPGLDLFDGQFFPDLNEGAKALGAPKIVIGAPGTSSACCDNVQSYSFKSRRKKSQAGHSRSCPNNLTMNIVPQEQELVVERKREVFPIVEGKKKERIVKERIVPSYRRQKNLMLSKQVVVPTKETKELLAAPKRKRLP